MLNNLKLTWQYEMPTMLPLHGKDPFLPEAMCGSSNISSFETLV